MSISGWTEWDRAPGEIAGMTPWLCEYGTGAARFCIVLLASDPDQLLEDNCVELPGLTILGVHHGTVTRK